MSGILGTKTGPGDLSSQQASPHNTAQGGGNWQQLLNMGQQGQFGRPGQQMSGLANFAQNPSIGSFAGIDPKMQALYNLGMGVYGGLTGGGGAEGALAMSPGQYLGGEAFMSPLATGGAESAAGGAGSSILQYLAALL